MGRTITVAARSLVAVLFLAIGLGFSGCQDSGSLSNEPEAQLSSLSVSPGVLRPAFSSNTVSYEVDVSTTVTSVTVTATPENNTTTMTINGAATNAGQGRTVALGGLGSRTSITIALTAQSGSRNTYVVVVNRTASNNSDLSALSVTPGVLSPAFAPSTSSYVVDVASTVTSVSVVATPEDNTTTMTINGAATGVGQGRTVTLGSLGSSTSITIVLTAQSGSRNTYVVVVNRAESGNNNLSALRVTPGALSPAFTAGTLTYTADVAATVTSVTVFATKSDSNAEMSGSITAGTGTASGQTSIQLGGPGTTTSVAITVTAQNGNSKTYRITVERAALASNNNLSALTVTQGSLDPGFASGTTTYTVDVATTVSDVTVTATKADSNASMVVNGQGTSSGQGRDIALGAPGSDTSISIVVTAPNGNSKTYRITVSRAASANNNLSALTVSSGSLAPPFTPSIVTYAVNVDSGVANVTITATKSDPNAVMSSSGSVIAVAGDPTGQVNASVGLGTSTEVLITVTAPDGTPKTYRITVSRPFR
ncbi:MAG: cadherin-like beta sandwich domain-containing protein [Nitrospira sp.]